MHHSDDYIFPTGSPDVVIKRFQGIVRIVASKYSRDPSISPYGTQDLEQHVHLKFIESFTAIKGNYQGRAKVRTYVGAVMRNLCLEFIRKNCKKQERSVTMDVEGDNRFHGQLVQKDGLDSIYIQEEVARFQRILLLFGPTQAKVELALKTYFRSPILMDCVLGYTGNHHKSQALASWFLEQINYLEQETDAERFTVLCQLFNAKEKKNNSVDATRKWTARKAEQVLELLNGKNGRRQHTKETLSILLDVSPVEPVS